MEHLDWKLWEHKDQEFTSANTSINKNKLPKLFTIISEKIGWKENNINLDIGGGKYDNVTEFLAKNNVHNYVYDPFNRSLEHNKSTIEKLYNYEGSNTVTLSNVLNVIKEDHVRTNTITQAYVALKPGGTVYISCYEKNGDGNGEITKPDCFQNNLKLERYLLEVKDIFNDAFIKWGIIIGHKDN